MRLRDYLRVFREQWPLLAVAALVGCLAAGAVVLLRPAQYTAGIQLYVSAQSQDPDYAYQAAQLAQDRVKSYTALLTGERVSSELVRDLRLTESPDALSQQITATSSPASVIIDVRVTDPSPRRAAQLANGIGAVFPAVVGDIERPLVPGTASPVLVRLVEPAEVPTGPSSTGWRTTLVLGLLAGLVIGVLVAIARNSLDVRVRTREKLSELTGAPTIGVLGVDPEVPRSPSALAHDPQSPRAEAFRQLRTNLQFIDVDRPPRVILITSATDGEGKSSTVADLAAAMAAAGQRVIAVDADLRDPALASMLDLRPSPGLTSVAAGQTKLDQAIQRSGPGRFAILTAGPRPPNPSELLGSQQLADVMDALRERYDTVLVDVPSLDVTDAAALAPRTDGVVLVCHTGRTTESQVRRAAQALDAVSARILGCVLSMVPVRGPRAQGQYTSYYRREQHDDQDRTSAAGLGTDRASVDG